MYFKLKARISDSTWQTAINFTNLGRTGVSCINIFPAFREPKLKKKTSKRKQYCSKIHQCLSVADKNYFNKKVVRLEPLVLTLPLSGIHSTLKPNCLVSNQFINQISFSSLWFQPELLIHTCIEFCFCSQRPSSPLDVSLKLFCDRLSKK